jgi:large subunit ribosomal protein L23
MMDASYIVKKPLITEKSTWEGTTRNRYCFVVAMSARKPQIKRAVEVLYGVRVLKVATQVRKAKYFRSRFGPAKTSDWKRATIQLHEDDRIELF